MQRYFVKRKEQNNLILEESDIHHIKNVMRMNINDKIEVVYDKVLYICNIDNLDPLTLSVEDTISKENKLNIELTIAIGLVKEQKIDLILQKLTELGVSRIIPVDMERSIVKLDKERFSKKKVRWQMICKEASEQSKRTDIPEITDIISIKDLVRHYRKDMQLDVYHCFCNSIITNGLLNRTERELNRFNKINNEVINTYINHLSVNNSDSDIKKEEKKKVLERIKNISNQSL